MLDSERRYNEREVQFILRIATASDVARFDHASSSVDLTAADLEDIAAASGIDRASIRDAIESWNAAAEGKLSVAVGGPTMLRIERNVSGELADVDVRDLAESMAWFTGSQKGQVVESSKGLRWVETSEEGPYFEVEIGRRAGSTQIRILTDRENPAGWSLIGAGLGDLLSGGVLIAVLEPSVALAAVVLASTTATCLLGLRRFWRRSMSRTRRNLTQLADRIEAHITAQLRSGLGAGIQRVE